MAVEANPPSRGPIAVIVATAAVTVAIGVTLAGLTGYLSPGRDAAPAASEPAVSASAAQPASPAPATAPAPIGPQGPSVVLVPVTPDPRAQPAAAPPGPELLLAIDPARPAPADGLDIDGVGGGRYDGEDEDDEDEDDEDEDDDDDRRRGHRGHHDDD